MEEFQQLKDFVAVQAQEMAKDVADRKVYSIPEITELLKIKLWFALEDAANLKVDLIQDYRKKKSEGYAEKYIKADYATKLRMGKEMAVVNNMLKDANKLKSTFFKDYNHYQNLKNFLKANNGESLLNAFYEANPNKTCKQNCTQCSTKTAVI